MSTQLLTSIIPSNVTGWWVSEKYDGVRAIWNGRKLLTRNGKDLKAPTWFIKGLPKNMRLDGELWMGRDTFNTLVSVIQVKDSDWQGVRYMVFDLAEIGCFEDRTSALLRTKLPAHVTVVHHKILSSHKQLAAMESDIVTNGGEGCVIRRPGCHYRPGRAGDVIKVKRLVADIDRWHG